MAFGSPEAAPPRGNYKAGCFGFAVLSLVLAVMLGVGYMVFRFDKAAAMKNATAVLDEQQRAWNAGDLAKFTATYHMHEGVTFFSEGRVYKGWEQLSDRYRQMYGGRPMGQLMYDNVSGEALAHDAVMLRGMWAVKSDAGTRTGLFTMLVRKFPDPEGWKVVHDHMTIGELR